MRLIDTREMQYLLNMVNSLLMERFLFLGVVGEVLDLLVLSKVVLLNTSFFHNPLNDFPFLGFLGVAWE
jgi:hypothetical protein